MFAPEEALKPLVSRWRHLVVPINVPRPRLRCKGILALKLTDFGEEDAQFLPQVLFLLSQFGYRVPSVSICAEHEYDSTCEALLKRARWYTLADTIRCRCGDNGEEHVPQHILALIFGLVRPLTRAII